MNEQRLFNGYTGYIIGANVVLFLVYLVLAAIYGQEKMVDLVAINPSAILMGKNIWTFITSMFMHAGLGHLFVNMVSLAFIGSFVERLIGKKRFLGLYFVGGIFAGLLFVLVAYFTGFDLNTYAVGASGAIFALGGLLAVLTPNLRVLVFFIIPLPMWAAMVFLMIGLWVISLGLGLPIGNVAHLGGLLVGLGYGFYLKNKYPKRAAIISKRFS